MYRNEYHYSVAYSKNNEKLYILDQSDEMVDWIDKYCLCYTEEHTWIIELVEDENGDEVENEVKVYYLSREHINGLQLEAYELRTFKYYGFFSFPINAGEQKGYYDTNHRK